VRFVHLLGHFTTAGHQGNQAKSPFAYSKQNSGKTHSGSLLPHHSGKENEFRSWHCFCSVFAIPFTEIEKLEKHSTK